MALVTGTRRRVEEFFEDGKGDFGMAHYEARPWTTIGRISTASSTTSQHASKSCPANG